MTDRRKRMSGAELKERVRAAAVEAIESGALPVAVELKVDKIADLAKVPRSSARRIWKNNTLLLEVMRASVDPERIEREILNDETIRRALDVRVRHHDLMAEVEGRRQVLAEAVRSAMTYYFQLTFRSTAWRTYAAMIACLPSLGEHVQEQANEILATADEETVKIMANYYSNMLEVFGMQFKPGYTAEVFAENVMGFVGGSAIRYSLGHRKTEPLQLPGLAGEVDWHPVSVGFLALIEGMTQADPDFVHEPLPPENSSG
ncbi:hypothetical protein [Nocardia salmonicida]|uniref:hypothetical protein n=1 Tax=Nocardia salmonicida TaxID=53431 RepID=UPI002E2E81E4|nr:hypothetical protein [Nocardia salmonicida]